MIREPIVYWLYQTCKLLLQLQFRASVSCNYAPLLVSDHRNTRTLYILDGLSVSISKQASRYGLHSCLAWPMTESFAWCSCFHLLPGTWLICQRRIVRCFRSRNFKRRDLFSILEMKTSNSLTVQCMVCHPSRWSSTPTQFCCFRSCNF